MVAEPEHIREVELDERDREIAIREKLRLHRRHQRKVGTINRLERQELSQLDYAHRLAHYLTQAHRLTSYRWLMELRVNDFRAYQAKLADVGILDLSTYLWWFSLGDEQRYIFIRESMPAVRDEREQVRRNARAERQKKLRESGEI